jgi:Domain of unknown function (DUF4314)
MDPLNIGDRIELVYMPNDPDPIPAGAQGTVEDVRTIDDWHQGHTYYQVHVHWDNGRTLSLVIPPDCVSVIGRA